MRFSIPINPVGQMRARHGTIKTKAGKTIHKTFKADKQEEREETLNTFLLRYKPSTPLTVPVALGIRANFSIPKSWSNKKKAKAAANEIRPTSKPDLDNVLKHVKDCLTAMRFWEDDALVVEYLPGTGKYYGMAPSIEIEILPIHLAPVASNIPENMAKGFCASVPCGPSDCVFPCKYVGKYFEPTRRSEA